MLEPAVETTSVAMIRALVRTGGMVSLLLHENVADDVGAGSLCWIPLTDPAARAEMLAKAQRTSVPQIFVNGTHVGGFDDLVALDRAGRFIPLLEQNP